MKPIPPGLPDKFLQWFCRDDLLEYIRGDLHELYGDRLAQSGKVKADLAFCWDVLRFFRLSNIRSSQNTFKSMFMLKNYLKVGYRSLKKNWKNSLINISGLSLSVGCAITTFLFADFFFNLNSIHTNKANIYQVVSHIEENQADELYGPSPMIIGEKLKADLPEIQEYVRVQYKRGNVKFGKNVFRELIQFADPAYLAMFDFPLVAGDRNALTAQSIFISSAIAKKYFGNIEPIGKRIDIKFGESVKSFDVAGVFGEVPANTSFRPKILLHMDQYLKLEAASTNWIDEAKATFVSVNPSARSSKLDQQLKKYQLIQNEANPSNPVTAYELIPFTEVSGMAGKIGDSVVQGNDKSGTIGIAVTGLLLILFACLNYINIAIASATMRLKEIGVRKVMGGSRKGIASQFLTENFLTCAFAMVVGTLACYFLLLPGFNQLSPIAIPFSFSSLPIAIFYFLGLFLLLGFLSGSYPAFYISRFQVLNIFKGERSLGGRNYLSKVLLTLQFFLAFVTILGCFIFTDHAQYTKQIGWGYEPSGILAFPIQDKKHLEALRNEADKHPQVIQTATSQHHIGVNNHLVPFSHLNHQFKILTYDVEPGYLETMNMTLLTGRFFEKKQGDRNTIVVNELFVEKMKWSDPIGESILMDGVRRTVVGVVANVYHAFFDNDIMRPMVFTAHAAEPNFLILQVTDESIVSVNEHLKSQWTEIAPFDPYVSVYQADLFDRAYDNVDANTWFMLSLSVLTIFLSCLGLYGLLAFTLQNRVKEFSIRKVLGASRLSIVGLANQEFVWILAISLGLGTLLGIWLMPKITESFFAIAKPFSIVPVVVCLLITFFTIVLTVFAQIRKVTKVNPATVLRGE
ncbi:MAG: ABC transporter permease [Cyclobacteriaceae bacterium]|nr:ABC transporter permease [Cyclobacteriaceae bacterium HetDA_MAG_MS6]